MQRKFFKYFLLLTLCLAYSCTKRPKAPYMVSNFAKIQDLETQDHRFCVSLNLDSAENNILESETYWRCRLTLAKYKLKADQSTAENKKFNFQIDDLVSKISLDLSERNGSDFIKEIRKLGDHHHRNCVRLGFDPDTLDRSVIDDYFLCRKRFIEDLELDPAYGNPDYLSYPNRTYNIGFVIDRRMKQEEKKVQEAAKKYPTCAKYNLRKKNFHHCSKAQDASRACFKEINRKKLKKEAIEKTICQKQSYIEFPNAFLKKQENKNLYIKEAKTNADIYNQNNFSSIGLNEDDVRDFKSETWLLENYKEKEKNINSKNELYSKTELTRLRQRYIYACHKESDIVVNKYVAELEKECEALKKFDEVDE